MWALSLNGERATDMARVFIGIGSNIEREKNIRFAIKAMHRVFGEMDISSVYESRAFGFDGDNFYNLVVGFDSALGPVEISTQLRKIEDELGRERDVPRYSSRTLDLDLLLYDDLVVNQGKLVLPRGDITRFAFVACPLAEIAGELLHPVTGQSYAELWLALETKGQELWRVDLDFSEE